MFNYRFTSKYSQMNTQRIRINKPINNAPTNYSALLNNNASR